MPNPVQLAGGTSGTMPSGGALPDTELTSADTPDTGAGTPATDPNVQQSNQWMPVFQIGAGQNGVGVDARGLISGNVGPAASAGQQVSNTATNAVNNAIAANVPPTPAGGSTDSSGASGGAASDIGSGAGQASQGDYAGANTPGPQGGDSTYNNLPEADQN
jgi:hypothetical protein